MSQISLACGGILSLHVRCLGGCSTEEEESAEIWNSVLDFRQQPADFCQICIIRNPSCARSAAGNRNRIDPVKSIDQPARPNPFLLRKHSQTHSRENEREKSHSFVRHSLASPANLPLHPSRISSLLHYPLPLSVFDIPFPLSSPFSGTPPTACPMHAHSLRALIFYREHVSCQIKRGQYRAD